MKNFKSLAKNIKEENFVGERLDGRWHLMSSKNVSHSAALEMGFKMDKENDVYVLDDFGAFVDNVSYTIATIEDMEKAYDEVLKCNPLHKILEMQKHGYEFCIGPSFPLASGAKHKYLVGLYCSNYEYMIQKANENSQSL